MDQLCWEILDSKLRDSHTSENTPKRPANYTELEWAIMGYLSSPSETDLPWGWPAFEHSWANFLDEFFERLSADFFAARPPVSFPQKYQALLAGAADYLCTRYDLDLPDWIDDEQYCLSCLCDWTLDLPELRSTRFRRCQRADPVFLKRNLIFEARGLIRL